VPRESRAKPGSLNGTKPDRRVALAKVEFPVSADLSEAEAETDWPRVAYEGYGGSAFEVPRWRDIPNPGEQASMMRS
jgi:hypothetical protein